MRVWMFGGYWVFMFLFGYWYEKSLVGGSIFVCDEFVVLII